MYQLLSRVQISLHQTYLKLAEIYVSEAMLDEVNKNTMLEAVSSANDMSFNSSQF